MIFIYVSELWIAIPCSSQFYSQNVFGFTSCIKHTRVKILLTWKLKSCIRKTHTKKCTAIKIKQTHPKKTNKQPKKQIKWHQNSNKTVLRRYLALKILNVYPLWHHQRWAKNLFPSLIPFSDYSIDHNVPIITQR